MVASFDNGDAWLHEIALDKVWFDINLDKSVITSFTKCHEKFHIFRWQANRNCLYT